MNASLVLPMTPGDDNMLQIPCLKILVNKLIISMFRKGRHRILSGLFLVAGDQIPFSC